MSYVMLLVLVLAVVGIAARAVLAARRQAESPPTSPGGSDVADRSVVPPAHPAEPEPGSATARAARDDPSSGVVT
jgi:predicted lipid-binding transport protein (Tim44 family)